MGLMSKVKCSTLSDFDNWGVKLYVSTQRSKVVMVTPTSDPFFGVKGQHKGQIFSFVLFRRLRCQIVRLGPTIESCYGDPDVGPFLRGQRSTLRSLPDFDSWGVKLYVSAERSKVVMVTPMSDQPSPSRWTRERRSREVHQLSPNPSLKSQGKCIWKCSLFCSVTKRPHSIAMGRNSWFWLSNPIKIKRKNVLI